MSKGIINVINFFITKNEFIYIMNLYIKYIINIYILIGHKRMSMLLYFKASSIHALIYCKIIIKEDFYEYNLTFVSKYLCLSNYKEEKRIPVAFTWKILDM